MFLEHCPGQPETKQHFDVYDLRTGLVFRRTVIENKWEVPRIDKTIENVRENYWFKGM